MTTVTFKIHTGHRTMGGGAAQASLGMVVTELALAIPTAIAQSMNLVDDRAAMYAAMFGGE